MSIKKTKIVCTLGPSSNTEDVIRNLMIEGMDVARLNFSHGSHEDKLKIVEIVKKVRAELHKPVALLLDTKGPEVRLGVFKEHTALLEEGKQIILVDDPTAGLTDEHVAAVLLLLRQQAEAGRPVLVASCDSRVAAVCDKLINFNERKEAE